jgi:zinc protease
MPHKHASKSKLTASHSAPAKVREHSLANGMRILIAERHSDPVVAVMLWYRVGSRNEREHEAGVSHFLEHMMFKGAERFGKGEIDRLTTMLGGSNNAFTSCDHTAYWFELASDRWEKALEIEADRMRALALEPAEFNAEREVVLEELSMGLDDPWRRLTELVQSTLFLRHPYRRPVIGHADALKQLSVAQMRDYWRRFYHPGNATLVICGDVDPAAALERARAHFEALPRGASYAEADPFRPAETPEPGQRRVDMHWDDQGKRLCIAWPTVPVGTPDDHALDVVSTLLTAGRLSRLQDRLVYEEELATSISTQSDTRVEGGVFWLLAECAQNADPRELERVLDEELERLRREPPSAKELARVRAVLRASEAFENETASDFAERLGEYAVDAHWKLALESLEHVLAVDAKAVRDCAARLLAPERRVVGWCTPKATPPKATSRRKSARRGAKQ